MATGEFTVNIRVAQKVQAILLNGLADGGELDIDLPADNVGWKIATVTVQTAGNKPYLKPLTISGDAGAPFMLTNGGVCPCDIVVGAQGLSEDASYVLTLTAL